MPDLVGAVVQHLLVRRQADAAIRSNVGQPDELAACPVGAGTSRFQRAETLAETDLRAVADILVRDTSTEYRPNASCTVANVALSRSWFRPRPVTRAAKSGCSGVIVGMFPSWY